MPRSPSRPHKKGYVCDKSVYECPKYIQVVHREALYNQDVKGCISLLMIYKWNA